MSNVRRLTSKFGGSTKSSASRKNEVLYKKKKKKSKKGPPSVPRRRGNENGTISNLANSITNSFTSLATSLGKMLTPKNETQSRKSRKKIIKQNLCTTCQNPMKAKSAKGLLFCSSECERYKQALQRTGLDVVSKSQRTARSRSVVERAKLKRVEPKKQTWGFFFTNRAAIPRKRSKKRVIRKTENNAVPRSSPPPIPKRAVTTPRSSVVVARPPVMTATKSKKRVTKKLTRRQQQPPSQVFSATKKKTPSVSRVKSKKNAGQSYLKRKGLSVDDIFKRSSVKSKNRSTKYAPKKRSIRTQPTKPMRVGKIPGKKQRLKAWCQERATSYGIKINNFSRSWKNGRAFCAIVYSACPSVSALRPENTKSLKASKRLQLAFDTAHVRLGVEPILEPEDITDLPRPDEKCVVLYVSMLHRAISSRG